MIEGAVNHGLDTAPVELWVAADPRQLVIVRTVAETTALLSDLTLDEVTDVRLAANEVATLLMLAAVPGAVVRCEFFVEDPGLRMRVSTVVGRHGEPDQRGFSWHVLQTLTTSIATTQSPYDTDRAGFPTEIEFSRLR